MADLPRHFVRFGSHNEQKYISDERSETYDGIAFNANLVAWSSTGIAGFLCGKGLWQKPHFIDPLTHGFQHSLGALSNDKGEIKQSVENLIDEYGDPIETAIRGKKRPVRKADFDEEAVRIDFTHRVLRFQQETLDDEAQEADTAEYLRFRYRDEFNLRPAVVVCPYFFMTEATVDHWLPLNLELARIGLEEAGDSGVVQLVIGRDVLTSEESIARIATAYTKELDADYYQVWVDGLSEHEASKRDLAAFRDLCNQLGRDGRKVMNLYGGFFSSLLAHPEIDTLNGVCHGPQYGEDRNVKPVGGGLPNAKFYLRQLHHRFRYREALAALRKKEWLSQPEQYFENICDCPACRKLVLEHGPGQGFGQYGKTEPLVYQRQGRTVTTEYAVRESLVHAAHHYMYAKDWEFRLIDSNDIEWFRRHLAESASEYGSLLGEDDVSYLRKWVAVLQ